VIRVLNQQTKDRIWSSTIHSLVPLLIGAFIYIGFRNRTTRFIEWLPTDVEHWIEEIQVTLKQFRIYLPNWFVNSLPDGLWAYSFTSAVLICSTRSTKGIWIEIALVFLLIITVETAQFIRPEFGTFDVFDLLWMISGFLLSVKFFKNK
jgi:hypothetical protein